MEIMLNPQPLSERFKIKVTNITAPDRWHPEESQNDNNVLNLSCRNADIFF